MLYSVSQWTFAVHGSPVEYWVGGYMFSFFIFVFPVVLFPISILFYMPVLIYLFSFVDSAMCGLVP